MKLRARLLLSAVLIICTLVIGFVGLAFNQRRFLYAQLDKQLTGIPLGAIPFAADGVRPGPLAGSSSSPPAGLVQPTAKQQAEIDQARSNSITDVAVALISSAGQVRFVVTPTDSSFGKPKLDASLIERALRSGKPLTAPADGGSAPFRVRAFARDTTGERIVLGLSTARVEEVQRQLARTALLAVGSILGLIALIGIWISRLGLRPIRALTDVAEAQLGGDRTRRVEHPALSTEAGQLGAAFNKMLDERERAENQLLAFVSDASHELRTPLTSIRGYLDLERNNAFPDEAQRADAMRRVRGETARMTGLVDDLLLLAQLDQGRPLDREQVDVSTLVDDIVHDTQMTLTERTIIVDIEPNLRVTGDRDRLAQVFTNLIRNAVVHTPVTSSITVTGRLYRLPKPCVRIEVSDTGPGLTPEQATLVFDRFYRGESSRSRDRGGAGLGLSIAKSIVDSHGGTLTLHSETGHGSVFTVEIPAALD